jgi:hypothetical protein
MTELSLMAETILDAFSSKTLCGRDGDLEYASSPAAAFRTLVDQVAPHNYSSFADHIEWDQGMEARSDSIRQVILSIADKLESIT